MAAQIQTGGGRTVQPVPMDAGRTRLGDIRFDSFFQYAVNITFDGTGINTVPATIAIQSDAHFMWVQGLYDMNFAAGVTPAAVSGGALVQITDGTQRQLSNIPVPVSTLFGTAQRPFVLPFTHIFKANTIIGIVATGSAAASAALTMRLVFAGFKLPLGSAKQWGLP